MHVAVCRTKASASLSHLFLYGQGQQRVGCGQSEAGAAGRRYVTSHASFTPPLPQDTNFYPLNSGVPTYQGCDRRLRRNVLGP
ncbi:hypothetical protein E2C01_079787 [Portunus trituberculatus]|uniref:Uncharacterized protein n=1 Tax=Portunus trituberculatus TaxID=210409 RepID=A0A5B7IS87_PORTR|nr:hypothetical protein [Portunus trituberculatus]